MKSKPSIHGQQRSHPAHSINPELNRIARVAPRQWRSEAALAKAGFEPVAGGITEAVRAARLRKLTLHLRMIRKQAGLTQAEVAKRMKTTASAVSRLEATNPENLTIDSLRRYADAVGAELHFWIA